MPDTMVKDALLVKLTGAALGADIENVDLAQVSEAEFRAIERVWHEHLVVRVRGQTLDDAALMRFSARFGKLDRVPIRAAETVMTFDPRLDVAPEAREFVTVISNVKIGGKAIGGLGSYESHWHTDMSYNDAPPIGSALYAIEVPHSGGNTGFANMYRAFETLPEEMRKRIDGLTCIHDASRNSVGQLRQGFEDVADVSKTVGAGHPVVRTHPVTKRKALFLGRRRNAYLIGLDVGESEALLDRLWEHATQPSLTWTQEWKVGDLVIWDNRCTMHRRDEFDDSVSRIMHRTQICGDRPY